MPFSTADIEAEPKPTEEERLERRREAVKRFVGDTDHIELGLGEPELTDSDVTIANNLAQLQREDPSLVEYLSKLRRKVVSCRVWEKCTFSRHAYSIERVRKKEHSWLYLKLTGKRCLSLDTQSLGLVI